ncbi:MAG: acyl-CoA dehydrogenase family protein, partial [Hyphococcus sp.]
MADVDPKDVKEFADGADAWFKENVNRDPGFMMPLTFMEVGTDQQFEFLRDWQHKVWEAGYLGAAWPKQYGGGGLDPAFQKAATDAMRRHGAPIMLNAIGLNWTGPLLLDIGSEDQKQKYIKGILSAEDIWCQGFSEPENGSDLGNAQLRAERDGEDYVLNGSKIWTTQGNYAKYMILLARTNKDAPNKYAGLSFFLAPMTVDGIETTPIRKLTGEY